MYLYMGHGSGEKVINSQTLEKVHNLDNLCILMGCGSVKLTNLNNYNSLEKSF